MSRFSSRGTMHDAVFHIPDGGGGANSISDIKEAEVR
jgi:hypothetical protein